MNLFMRPPSREIPKFQNNSDGTMTVKHQTEPFEETWCLRTTVFFSISIKRKWLELPRNRFDISSSPPTEPSRENGKRWRPLLFPLVVHWEYKKGRINQPETFSYSSGIDDLPWSWAVGDCFIFPFYSLELKKNHRVPLSCPFGDVRTEKVDDYHSDISL